MDGHNDTQQGDTVPCHPHTRDDLLAVALLTRRDPKDVLADAVEAVRGRLEPRLTVPAAKAGRKSKTAG